MRRPPKLDFYSSEKSLESDRRQSPFSGICLKEGFSHSRIKLAAGAGVAVVGVGGKIINKVLQDTEKDIVKKGVKVIETAAKHVIKIK